MNFPDFPDISQFPKIVGVFLRITSKQLSARHKLKDEQLQICCNNTELERVTEWKETTWFNY